MQLQGRNFQAGDYRYGFNGKEDDNEVKGEGNHLIYDERSYDPRIARWLSRDPKSLKYPGLSPYNFAGNNPIIFIDPDGADFYFFPMDNPYPWQSFQSIVRSQFSNLITVDRVEVTLKGHPVIADGKYYKLVLTINEVELQVQAIARAGGSTDQQLIELKKKEIRNELDLNVSYQKLNEVVKPGKDAIFRIDFGSTTGERSFGPGLPQGIYMNNIRAFDTEEIVGLSFSVLLHEIREGFYIQNGAGLNDKEFDPADPYQYGHWNAMADQAKAAGVDFIWSAGVANGFEPYNQNGNIVVFVYKKVEGRDEYEKTTYTYPMVQGKIYNDQVKEECVTVSAENFRKDVNKAKASLQGKPEN